MTPEEYEKAKAAVVEEACDFQDFLRLKAKMKNIPSLLFLIDNIDSICDNAGVSSLLKASVEPREART